jgi:hypothetical protein
VNAKVQHYVPQFLLRNFAVGKNHQLWAYDKHSGKSFLTTVRNVAAESRFYDLPIDSPTPSVEPILTELESNASATIRKLIETRRLTSIDETEKAWLAIFIAVQQHRTPAHRERMRAMSKDAAEAIRRLAKANGWPPPSDVNEFSDDQIKLAGIQHALQFARIAPLYLEKTWMLFSTTNYSPYFISDCPVTLDNAIDHWPYGNLGIASPGIEIYLPLTLTLAIGLFSENFRDSVYELMQKLEALSAIVPIEQLKTEFAGAYDRYEAMSNGTPAHGDSDNLLRFNSRQVAFSERFVYSRKNDFELVERMISDNKRYRHGMRMELATEMPEVSDEADAT